MKVTITFDTFAHPQNVEVYHDGKKMSDPLTRVEFIADMNNDMPLYNLSYGLRREKKQPKKPDHNSIRKIRETPE